MNDSAPTPPEGFQTAIAIEQILAEPQVASVLYETFLQLEAATQEDAPEVSYWTMRIGFPGTREYELTVRKPGKDTPAEKAKAYKEALRDIERLLALPITQEEFVDSVRDVVEDALAGEP